MPVIADRGRRHHRRATACWPRRSKGGARSRRWKDEARRQCATHPMSTAPLTWIPRPVADEAVTSCVRTVTLRWATGRDAVDYRESPPEPPGVLLRTAEFRRARYRSRAEPARSSPGTAQVTTPSTSKRRPNAASPSPSPARPMPTPSPNTSSLCCSRSPATSLPPTTLSGTARWTPPATSSPGIELTGRTMGLLGCGRIGRRVAGHRNGARDDGRRHRPRPSSADADALGID